jgi:guanylate kinase
VSEFDAQGLSAKGAALRSRRALLKAEISDGRHHLIELFDQASEAECDPVLSGLRVEWFLRSIPGFGVTKAKRLLERLGINPRATLGGLRVRQRSSLRREVVALRRRYFASSRGHLVVLVGPSGVGKGTIVSWITEHHPRFAVSVSATTRAPRAGEVEGVHYYFVTDQRFDALVRDGELVEWASVHGLHRYGTPREAVEAQLDAGVNVILEIDIQGARQVKRAMKSSISIFVAPPTFDELERRLAGRATESDAERAVRLTTARFELAAAGECDHVVVNDSVDVAGQSIVDLVTASTSTTPNKE